ncbi:hypothetical protein KSS87_022040 [Heliosperma pusillum]|nr:hypothetical protein KSS87_022040 [Heliosperma pusillum]
MVKKGKIAHYRETLDKTLASDNLTDENKLQTLVKDQILRSSVGKTRDYNDNVLKKRTAEVSNFLEMLRSVSNEHGTPDNTHRATWKLKQDTEEFRVMYREGPVGSPFHSLLVEGYIDAPLDVCLCVSWDTALYPRWFPDMLIPTFKVVAAKSLQKVMIGEEISLVSREAILHYFEFEYLEDGLVVVLINTISDVHDIHVETHGFTNEAIPEIENTVRIDLVGGFALQRVTESRSYFRTIANMDIKLDFVPPSLINFISRQVIGSGFRFYQKTVASVSKGDEAFAKVLSGPLYNRIREALSSSPETKNLEISNGKRKADLQDLSLEDYGEFPGSNRAGKTIDGCEPSNNGHPKECRATNVATHKKLLGDMFLVREETNLCNGVNGNLKSLDAIQHKPATEIEEEDIGGGEIGVKDKNNDHFEKICCNSADQLQLVNLHKKVPISPQVEKALGALDKMINVVREGRLGARVEAGEATSSTTRINVEGTFVQGISMQQNVSTTAHVSTNGVIPIGLRKSNPKPYFPKIVDCVVRDVGGGEGGDWMGWMELMVAEVCTSGVWRFKGVWRESMDQDLHARGANPGVTFTSPVQNPPIGSWSRNAVSAGNSPVVDSSVNLDVDSSIHENNKKNGQPRKWKLCCLHIDGLGTPDPPIREDGHQGQDMHPPSTMTSGSRVSAETKRDGVGKGEVPDDEIVQSPVGQGVDPSPAKGR